MQINYQLLGDFTKLDLRLPTLSQRELNSFDVEKELSSMERLVEAGILPSG